jgi:hypothetical protein
MIEGASQDIAPSPRLVENGILTVIVSQGADGDFNGGKTVLEYQSSDIGATWELVREYERQSEGGGCGRHTNSTRKRTSGII